MGWSVASDVCKEGERFYCTRIRIHARIHTSPGEICWVSVPCRTERGGWVDGWMVGVQGTTIGDGRPSGSGRFDGRATNGQQTTSNGWQRRAALLIQPWGKGKKKGKNPYQTRAGGSRSSQVGGRILVRKARERATKEQHHRKSGFRFGLRVRRSNAARSGSGVGPLTNDVIQLVRRREGWKVGAWRWQRKTSQKKKKV